MNKKKHKTLIIAEAGVNHNGLLKLAVKLVKEAKKCGADIVKFQTFNPDKLITRSATKAKYQFKYTSKKETQYKMLKKLMLTTKMHKELMKYCKKKKIEFLSTAFDNESLKMLIRLGIRRIKIPSGEINNRQLLEFAGKKKLPIIFSTGMSYLSEVMQAIKIITKSGTSKSRITVLHCTSEYPLPLKGVNLFAMKSIERKLKISIGYSDHTLSKDVPVAAVALGAKIIEKHFTLSRNLIGPDHKSSLEPNELKSLVSSIRNIELALGKEIKAPTRMDIKNKIAIRRSLVALKPINKGDIFTKYNVGAKRPGSGISPMRIYELIGTRAKRNFALDELIK